MIIRDCLVCFVGVYSAIIQFALAKYRIVLGISRIGVDGRFPNVSCFYLAYLASQFCNDSVVVYGKSVAESPGLRARSDCHYSIKLDTG